MTKREALLTIEDIMIKASNLHTLYHYRTQKTEDYIKVCRQYRNNLDKMSDKDFADMLPEVERMSKDIDKTYLHYTIYG